MIKEITYYIASDGTTFENKNKANEYELNNLCSSLTSDDLLIIDHYGRYYSPSTEFVKGIEAATTLKVKTEKGLNALKEAYEYLGLTVPKYLGIFRLEDDEWIDLKDEIDILNYKWQGVVDIEYEEK